MRPVRPVPPQRVARIDRTDVNMSEKPFTASNITALEPIFSPMISFAAESSRFMMIPATLNLIITLFRFFTLASNVFPFSRVAVRGGVGVTKRIMQSVTRRRRARIL